MKRNKGSLTHLQAIITACHKGLPGVIKVLVEARRDLLNAELEHGTTPLMAAINAPTLDALKFLLLHPELQVNYQNCYKATALHHAISIHNAPSPALNIEMKSTIPAIVHLLNHPQIKLNLQDNDGCTPLFLACKNGDPHLVRILIQCAVDPHLADKNGHTAYTIAQENGHTAITELLQQKYGDSVLPLTITVELPPVSTPTIRDIIENEDIPAIQEKIKALIKNPDDETGKHLTIFLALAYQENKMKAFREILKSTNRTEFPELKEFIMQIRLEALLTEKEEAIKIIIDFSRVAMNQILRKDTMITPINYLILAHKTADDFHQRIFKYITENYPESLMQENFSPLSMAIEQGKLEIIKILLACPRFDVNGEQINSVDHALKKENIVVLQMLLEDPLVKVTSIFILSAINFSPKNNLSINSLLVNLERKDKITSLFAGLTNAECLIIEGTLKHYMLKNKINLKNSLDKDDSLLNIFPVKSLQNSLIANTKCN